jgi:hypothetical protein
MTPTTRTGLREALVPPSSPRRVRSRCGARRRGEWVGWLGPGLGEREGIRGEGDYAVGRACALARHGWEAEWRVRVTRGDRDRLRFLRPWSPRPCTGLRNPWPHEAFGSNREIRLLLRRRCQALFFQPYILRSYGLTDNA